MAKSIPPPLIVHGNPYHDPVFAASPHNNLAHDPVHVRTATYVVAASDAPAHMKAQADYVCDGTDDQVEIQAAIDAAFNDQGGIVFLPPGTYTITSLEVREGVTLQGSSRWARGWTGGGARQRSTWIHCVSEIDPAITMRMYTSLKNLVFFYPNQVTDFAGGGAPTVYPATITATIGTGRVLIRDVAAINPYVFIDISLLHELLTIENVNAYPLYRGLVLDNSVDIDRISNVHFNPNIWPDMPIGGNLPKWVFANATAFDIGRLDWARFYNCFCFGYQFGFHLKNLGSGVPKQILLHGCGADRCYYPFFVRWGWGIKIIDCDAVSSNEYDAAEITGPAVNISSGDTIVENLRIWGSTSTGIRVLGTAGHPTSNVTIRGCNIMEYGVNAHAGHFAYGIIINDYATNVIVEGNQVDGQARAWSTGILLYGVNRNNQITIIANNVRNTGPAGISMGVGPVDVICTNNLLKATAGLTDNLGAVSKVVTNNITVP